MKKIMYLIIMILLVSSVTATQICSNKGESDEICFNIDESVMPQNSNLFEGENDNYNLYVETASFNEPEKPLKNALLGGVFAFFSNKLDEIVINPDELDEITTYEFKSYTDFYSYLQEANAIGNVTLFTTKDLNQLTRDYNQELNYRTWSLISSMTFLITEFFKLIINLMLLFGSAYLFFKFLPFILTKVKEFIFWIVIKLGGNNE